MHCGLYHHPRSPSMGGLRAISPEGRLRSKGDPLSPYLFVLAMEVFSRILVKASSNGRFSHHPRCAKLDLTHLCFADDLLLFCQGDPQSNQPLSLKRVLIRLMANPDKKPFFGWMKILSTMLRTFFFWLQRRDLASWSAPYFY